MTAPLAQASAEDARWKRTILYFASRDALGERTDAILSRLGYQMLLPETFADLRERHPELAADMLVVDERRLGDVEAFEGLPIVVLTGRQGAPRDDDRVVGAVKRPAGLHDLYRLMQQVFEEVPRATPRVPTQLPARCTAQGRSWEGRVLSLSENGCLIRSPEAILLGQRIDLCLELPDRAAVELVAEATYQLLPDTGLVFSSLAADRREAIGRYVTEAILA